MTGLILLFSSFLTSQDLIRHCGTTHIPTNATEINTTPSYPRLNIEIPIVIHVVWHSEEENLPDNVLTDQIEVINEDFNRLNPLTKHLPKSFHKKVGTPGISFCLAKTDPQGNPSNGIIRTKTQQTDIANQSSLSNGDRRIKESELGGSSPWDTELYLNIWIGSRSDGLTGEATFPNDPDETEADGIILDFSVVGRRPDTDSPFNLGRTLTHEIGHYLNVFHLYGSETGCFNDDDLVDDTPSQFGPYFGSCDEEVSSCGSKDMDTNFMNFRDDRCLFYFTKGQVDRMLQTLFTTRYALINSKTCSELKPLPPDPLRLAPIVNLPNGIEIPLRTLNEEEYTLTLYDFSGRRIWRQDSNPEHRYVILNSEVHSNIYVLVLALKDQIFSRKVFIN